VHYQKRSAHDNLQESLGGRLFRGKSNGDEEEMKATAATAGTENEKHQTHETLEPEQRHPQLAGTPSVEEIRQRAYEIHLERGGVHGWDQDDWLQAERDLAQKYSAS
jgi:hypothetical protein